MGWKHMIEKGKFLFVCILFSNLNYFGPTLSHIRIDLILPDLLGKLYSFPLYLSLHAR
jgi:hypothetical protein